MRRTKIFYFIPNLQQGGAEGQILQLIKELPPRFEPVLCVYSADDIFFDSRCPPGQPAYSLGVRRMGPAALARLTQILRSEKPDILHSYRDKANFWARLAGARARVPVTVTSCRNRMMELRYLLIEKLMSRLSHLILVNSIGVKHELTRYGRVPPDKVRVIHNLLDVEYFRPPSVAERDEARARWELRPGQRTLVVPGRIGLQKYQLGIVWAMRELARAGQWPSDAVVLFAGRERDRLTSALVHRLARHPRLAGRIRFLGAVKDVRSLYWASDVLLLPSLYEGLANAALEGCAAGLPAILSHATNIDDIVEPGRTGWQVPTLGVRPLARALAEALSTPAEVLQQMGRLSRERVLRRFAPRPNHVLDQTVAIYDELLAGTPLDGPREGNPSTDGAKPDQSTAA